jgi:hypothetical protein
MAHDYDYHHAKAWEHQAITDHHLKRNKELKALFGADHPDVGRSMEMVRKNYWKAQEHFDAMDALRPPQV